MHNTQKGDFSIQQSACTFLPLGLSPVTFIWWSVKFQLELLIWWPQLGLKDYVQFCAFSSLSGLICNDISIHLKIISYKHCFCMLCPLNNTETLLPI